MSNIIKSGETVFTSDRITLYRDSSAHPEETALEPDGQICNSEILVEEEVQRILEDARIRANQSSARILEDAYARRDKIVSTAEEDMRRLRLRAREEGLQEGMAEASERICGIVAAMNETLGQMRAEQNENYRILYKDMTELGLAMAEKILHKRITEDETDMLELARAAAASEKDKKNIVVKVSARMPKLADQLEKELSTGAGFQGTIKVKPADLPEGACRVETEEGITDASVYVQLENLREQLLQMEKEE